MSKKASADFRQALLLFRPLKTRLMYGRINRIAAYPPETEVLYMHYDIIIIGAGPGGIFSAYELSRLNPDLKVAVFEAGHPMPVQ